MMKKASTHLRKQRKSKKPSEGSSASSTSVSSSSSPFPSHSSKIDTRTFGQGRGGLDETDTKNKKYHTTNIKRISTRSSSTGRLCLRVILVLIVIHYLTLIVLFHGGSPSSTSSVKSSPNNKKKIVKNHNMILSGGGNNDDDDENNDELIRQHGLLKFISIIWLRCRNYFTTLLYQPGGMDDMEKKIHNEHLDNDEYPWWDKKYNSPKQNSDHHNDNNHNYGQEKQNDEMKIINRNLRILFVIETKATKFERKRRQLLRDTYLSYPSIDYFFPSNNNHHHHHTQEDERSYFDPQSDHRYHNKLFCSLLEFAKKEQQSQQSTTTTTTPSIQSTTTCQFFYVFVMQEQIVTTKPEFVEHDILGPPLFSTNLTTWSDYVLSMADLLSLHIFAMIKPNVLIFPTEILKFLSDHIPSDIILFENNNSDNNDDKNSTMASMSNSNKVSIWMAETPTNQLSIPCMNANCIVREQSKQRTGHLLLFSMSTIKFLRHHHMKYCLSQIEQATSIGSLIGGRVWQSEWKSCFKVVIQQEVHKPMPHLKQHQEQQSSVTATHRRHDGLALNDVTTVRMGHQYQQENMTLYRQEWDTHWKRVQFYLSLQRQDYSLHYLSANFNPKQPQPKHQRYYDYYSRSKNYSKNKNDNNGSNRTSDGFFKDLLLHEKEQNRKMYANNQNVQHDAITSLQTALVASGILPHQIYMYDGLLPDFILYDDRWEEHIEYMRYDPRSVKPTQGSGWWFWRSALLEHHLIELVTKHGQQSTQEPNIRQPPLPSIYGDASWFSSPSSTSFDSMGDFIIFSNPDFWSHLPWLDVLLRTMIDRQANVAILAVHFHERAWTKRDMYEVICASSTLNSNQRYASERYQKRFMPHDISDQYAPGLIILRTSPGVYDLLQDYVHYASNFHLLSDEESILADYPEFRDHRRDQSIISLLLKCQYGDSRKQIFEHPMITDMGGDYDVFTFKIHPKKVTL